MRTGQHRRKPVNYLSGCSRLYGKIKRSRDQKSEPLTDPSTAKLGEQNMLRVPPLLPRGYGLGAVSHVTCMDGCPVRAPLDVGRGAGGPPAWRGPGPLPLPSGPRAGDYYYVDGRTTPTITRVAPLSTFLSPVYTDRTRQISRRERRHCPLHLFLDACEQGINVQKKF